jgi:hypothetical protein
LLLFFFSPFLYGTGNISTRKEEEEEEEEKEE